MPQEYNEYGFRRVMRIVKSSNRKIMTLEFKIDPDVFWTNMRYRNGGWNGSGPFPNNDPRFELLTPENDPDRQETHQKVT